MMLAVGDDVGDMGDVGDDDDTSSDVAGGTGRHVEVMRMEKSSGWDT